MSQKKVIRRALALGFCLLLAIVALLFPVKKTIVRAGAGNGVNRKVESTEELSALLEHVSGRMGESGTAFASLAASSASEYESVTLEDTMRMSLKISQGLRLSRTTIDRQMTAYFTEDATYYVTEATISSKVVIPEERDKGEVVTEEIRDKADVSIRLHIYRDDEVCMILFERFTAVINGETHSLPSDVLGKWVLFSAEDDMGLYEEIASIDMHNFEVLSLMGRVLEDKTNFDRSGDIYTMDDDIFDDFVIAVQQLNGVDSSYLPEGYTGKGSFVANLRNSRTPKVTLEYNETYSTELSSLTMKSSSSEELAFSNIDNTVVKAPSSKRALTPEELVDFLEDWEG